MAWGEYREGGGMYEDYLQPDQGNVGSLVAGAAMLAMLYTPLGGKLTRTIGRAGEGIWKGATWAAPKIAKVAAIKVAPAAYRSAVKTIGGTGRALKYLGKPLSWASNNQAAAMGVGLGAAAIFGGMKGLKARQPQGETFTEDIMFDSSRRRGLSPNHLGATGDLTLALHGRR